MYNVLTNMPVMKHMPETVQAMLCHEVIKHGKEAGFRKLLGSCQHVGCQAARHLCTSVTAPALLREGQ